MEDKKLTDVGVLKDWVRLNKYLQYAQLENVRDLIVYEENTKNRLSYLVRLYRRYYMLLLKRKLEELRNG